MTESPYDVSKDNLATKSPSVISIFINILTSPSKAFKDMQADYPVLFPLFTIVTLNVVLMVMLFSSIDFSWYVDYMVEATAGDKSRAEQDQVRQGLEMIGPTGYMGIAIVGVVIGIPIIFCLFALYFVIVSNVRNDGFQFKQWLSFISWTSIPALIGTLASFVAIMTISNGQIAPEKINPLSFNELFFNLDAVQGVGNILASADITLFWVIGLMIIGYAKWTESSYGKALSIILGPYFILFGIRFLLV